MKLTLNDFANDRIHNAWIQHGLLSCYIRRDRHFIHGSIRNVLTLANFTNNKTKHRAANMVKIDHPVSTGALRKLDQDMYKIAQSAGLYGIHVENVLNEWLPEKLLEYGYYYVKPGEFLPCFIKLVT